MQQTLKKNNCAICLTDIEANPVFTPCIHPFHDECIDKWITQNIHEEKIPCPICKFDISELAGPRDPNTIYRDETNIRPIFGGFTITSVAPLNSIPRGEINLTRILNRVTLQRQQNRPVQQSLNQQHIQQQLLSPLLSTIQSNLPSIQQVRNPAARLGIMFLYNMFNSLSRMPQNNNQSNQPQNNSSSRTIPFDQRQPPLD